VVAAFFIFPPFFSPPHVVEDAAAAAGLPLAIAVAATSPMAVARPPMAADDIRSWLFRRLS